MILERDSSILGYPGETSKALNADHHNVCKYDSPRDPNYITVRNALQSFISKITSTSGSYKRPLPNPRESQDLKSLLAITEPPDTDYIFFRDQWTQGTNDWIFQEKAYVEWRHVRGSAPSLLWLNGGPATGKSVLSSSIVNNLVEDGVSCQYFFIRFGDLRKRTLSPLLRSIVYQIARCMPSFLQSVLQLVDEGIDFETADPRTIWERIFKSILFTVEGDQPLYWIIDGLDEANDPRMLIRLFSDISLSSLPIRILLVGRKTSEIAAVFHKVPTELNPGLISIEGHLGDLRRYIHQQLIMYGTAKVNESIVQRIVVGAQNNFLVSFVCYVFFCQAALTHQWVRLTVDKLKLCHTQADVELALEELPVGMETLYDRMASSIAQNPSATNRALALTILQGVTCSIRVLTVSELSQALHKDTSKLLNFQQSIVDLCGGFVVVDNSGNVSIIHHTAREYLLSQSNHPVQINEGVAQQQMFLSCMRCLMAIGLRAKCIGNQKPDLLDYAASSWSSHLVSTPLEDRQVSQVLNKFLTGRWVLIWIQVLAVTNQLRVLIRASRNLSRYSAKRKEYDAAWNEKSIHIVKRELIDQWAVDFVKIIGKFGTILRRNPESIYKLIPPFCPKNSAIYQYFGETKDKRLVVSGLPIEHWDDSLARMSFGSGTYASSISAAGAHIAILVSSGSASRNVVLYDSTFFEEAKNSPVKHSEYVQMMGLNSIGTLLATCGYLTTKVWELSSGECKMSIANINSRPTSLAILFTNNSTMLLVGTDDRRIRSLNLAEGLPTWQLVAELEEPELEGHFLHSASRMALTKDGGLVAVACRGHPLSAWETDGPTHIGHCWRKSSTTGRNEVIEAVWHPHYPEILGLYNDGVVFKWRPYDGENDEIATGASRLAMSKDGNLFAAGDVLGTVKVYISYDFCLIYQLTSEDNVLGLVFGPDLHRLYDVRGYYGNAWEPNALMRYAEQRGTSLESESKTDSLGQSSTASESRRLRIDSITVLACSPLGRLYCCGTQKGIVRLNDTQRGKLADVHVSKSFLSIELMSWSDDGQYLCFSDLSEKVTILSITPSTGKSDPIVATKAEIKLKNSTDRPLLQLLFHPDSSQLLVRSSSMICTICLAASSVTATLEIQTAEWKLINHPRDPNLIIRVGPKHIQILDWNLALCQTYELEYPSHQITPMDQDHSSNHDTVDRILVTQDKKQTFVQLSSLAQSSRQKTFLIIATTSLSPSAAATEILDPESRPTARLVPFILPGNPSSQIALALSFLSHNNLIYLSRNNALCSLRLPLNFDPSLSSPPPRTSHSAIATHPMDPKLLRDHSLHHASDTDDLDWQKSVPLFSLPGDWISRDCLVLCCIWSIERSLLCPRNGNVAVVRCASLV